VSRTSSACAITGARSCGAFPLLFLSFKDDGKPRPAWFYRRALKFYNRAMTKAGSKVFVMCRAGRRRSASLTYFLLRASGIPSRRAERLVFTARPCAMIPRAYRVSAEEYLWRK
jgi:protein-tyrosine phosphatase